MNGRFFTISVDVEDFFSPRLQVDTYSSSYGIMDLCELHGVKATFFVDPDNCTGFVSAAKISQTVKAIQSRGHEVALHTHPPVPRSAKVNDRVLLNYDYDRQFQFISQGAKKIADWTGEFPKSHRAGSYGANQATFRALADVGIMLDSSVFWGSQDFSFLPESEHRQISSFMIEKIREYPVSSYNLAVRGTPFNLRKKTDINWCSSTELQSWLEYATPQRFDLFLHSYSLLNLDNGKVSNYFVNNFCRALELAKSFSTSCVFSDLPRLVAQEDFRSEINLSRSPFSFTWAEVNSIYLPQIKKRLGRLLA